MRHSGSVIANFEQVSQIIPSIFLSDKYMLKVEKTYLVSVMLNMCWPEIHRNDVD